MAPIGAGVYALSALSALFTGWASDRWLRAGAGSNRVRKTGLIAGFATLTGCLLACAHAGRVEALLAMAGCGVGLGILTVGIFSSVQTLAGPGAVGRWFGVQNFAANLSGVSAPIITGVVVDHTGSFASAFVIAAALAVAGMIAYGLIVRRIEPIDWHAAASP
jgi:MFS family permease